MVGKEGSFETAVIVSPDRFQLVDKVKESCVVQITNVSFEAVMFRVMSTSPQFYFVKPSKGIIKPNSSATVTIMLNKNFPKTESLSSDDFRLEYAVVQQNDTIANKCANVPDIIKAKKQKDRSLVFPKLIRCSVNYPGVDAKSKDDNDTTPASKPVEAEEDGKEAEVGSCNSMTNQKDSEKGAVVERNRQGQLKGESSKRKMLMLLGLAAVTALVGVCLMFSS